MMGWKIANRKYEGMVVRLNGIGHGAGGMGL